MKRLGKLVRARDVDRFVRRLDRRQPGDLSRCRRRTGRRGIAIPRVHHRSRVERRVSTEERCTLGPST